MILSDKELNDYFLRFTQVHPIIQYKPELYKNNKLIQYQLLLIKEYDKEYIQYAYNQYNDKLKKISTMKDEIVCATKKILETVEREAEDINNAWLDVRINNIKLREFEL